MSEKGWGWTFPEPYQGEVILQNFGILQGECSTEGWPRGVGSLPTSSPGWILGEIVPLEEWWYVGTDCPGKWGTHCPWSAQNCADVALRDMVSGYGGVGLGLDLGTLYVFFSNLNNSVLFYSIPLVFSTTGGAPRYLRYLHRTDTIP